MDDVRQIAEIVRCTSSNLLEGKPTEEDFRALKDVLWTESNIDGFVWIGLLKKSQECLSDFWLAIHRANTALQCLEPTTAASISDAFSGNWAVKCQAAIDSATSWLKWTRPLHGQDADTSISRFISLTAKSAPDFSPAMLQLEERMNELFALRGQVEIHGPTIEKRLKRKGAHRQARTRKDTAILKAHIPKQRYETTAKIARVFTRDGLPDVKLVKRVVKRECERRRRSS
jgi:hypothetical protein